MLEVHEGEPCRLVTDRGIIVADEIVVAANVPSLNRFFVHTKIAPYRTYACALVVLDEFDANHLFWDNADPYHYIRSYRGVDGITQLIVGGEDHKTGHEDHTGAAFKRLEEWARDRFKVDRVSYKWSGQIIEPADGLPYIGRNPLSDHVFIATGYSGTGMTFGTIAGMVLSDLIIGNQNPWADLYDATRVKPFAAARAFLAENIDYPSHLISDRLTPAQESSTTHLRENEGAIVRVGSKKIAAYRDPTGELHVLSPVCPHLGCYVNWNEAEKSWDCPCHGSRFSPVGKLLNGPAVADLASESYDENMPMIPERYEVPMPNPDPLAPPLLSLFTCPIRPGK
jgi:Rieske Fe-S protein